PNSESRAIVIQRTEQLLLTIPRSDSKRLSTVRQPTLISVTRNGIRKSVNGGASEAQPSEPWHQAWMDGQLQTQRFHLACGSSRLRCRPCRHGGGLQTAMPPLNDVDAGRP